MIGECMDGKEKYTFKHKTECFLLKRQTDKKRQLIRKAIQTGPVRDKRDARTHEKKPTTPIT